MIAKSKQQSTGCGCGGGATTSTAQCTCCGAGCAACDGQGITRPRFFAGQLLTEDDLQLLGDYVSHKNRLHNRSLFGAGVVCGLEVTCHPCGDGQVIVHPGYALDCCGNDLTLPCAQTLDINAMIRDLRRDQLGGFDCVDPCPDPPRFEADCKDGDNSGPRSDGSGESTDKVETPKQTTRTYCLYIRYCEQKTDPVMPYSTGEDCGRLNCEESRVREGTRFELRCKPGGDLGHPLYDRLCQCVGDLKKLLDVRDKAQTLNNYAQVIRIGGSEPPADLPQFDKSVLIGQLRNVIVRAPIDRVDLTAGEAKVEVKNAGERTTLTTAATALLSIDITSFRNAVLQLHSFDRLIKANPQAVTDSDRAEVLAERSKLETVQRTILVTSSELNARIRDWLLERLDNSPFLTDCTLRQRLKTLDLTPPATVTDRRIAASYGRVNAELLKALNDYLRDCICRALNPACEPCEDSAVLLACLEVKDCDVVKICNMERTYVLSPAAVRYWMPQLQLIGNLMERLCCGSHETDAAGIPGTPTVLGMIDNRLIIEETSKMLNASLCRNTTVDPHFVEAFSHLLNLAMKSSDPIGLLSLPTTGRTGAAFNPDRLAAQIATPIETPAAKTVEEPAKVAAVSQEEAKTKAGEEDEEKEEEREEEEAKPSRGRQRGGRK